MKLLTSLFILFYLFAGCQKQQDNKDIYIKEKMPFILENLSTIELASFKEAMLFNEENALISYDMDLLEKGAGKYFDSVITNITRDFGGDISRIILVDEFGNERIIENKKIHHNVNGVEFDLELIKNWEGVFLITSLTCPHCLVLFEDLNKLATSSRNKDYKFVSLFIQSPEVLDNYKKGTAYENFGFLNPEWNVFFSSEELIQEIHPTYFEEEHGYPYFFFRKDGENIEIANDKESIAFQLMTELLNSN